MTSAGTDPSNPNTNITASQQQTLDSNPDIRLAYERAADETLRCLEQKGIRGGSLVYDAAGKARFEWAGFSARSEAQASGEVFKAAILSTSTTSTEPGSRAGRD